MDSRMQKAFIWGAGTTGEKVYSEYKDKMHILGFIDSDISKQATKLNGVTIYSPDILKSCDYDRIIIATVSGQDIPDTLEKMGISTRELDDTYVNLMILPRVKFLKSFAELVKDSLQGSVAEVGVFRGDFAKEINKYFPNSPCHLFDTFTGFDMRDLRLEKNGSAELKEGHLSATCEELVYDKMPYKKNVYIHKGYFPETATEDVLAQQFVFVNLDTDLYKPTLEGLRLFWPRMLPGGVVLIHDFFNNVYCNVKQAVKDFENELGASIHKTPIGDELSIALIK